MTRTELHELAEAIRLGSMLHRQCFGGMYEHSFSAGRGEVVATCALGAAAEAGYPATEYLQLNGKELLEQPRYLCPTCGSAWRVAGLITHLNDHHRWTRQAIADRVDAWARTLPEPVPEPEAVCV